MKLLNQFIRGSKQSLSHFRKGLLDLLGELDDIFQRCTQCDHRERDGEWIHFGERFDLAHGCTPLRKYKETRERKCSAYLTQRRTAVIVNIDHWQYLPPYVKLAKVYNH